MKKLISVLFIAFTCTLFVSQLSAQTSPQEVYAGDQVTINSVFSVNFGSQRCLGYSASLEKITPSDTGLIYFKFVNIDGSPGSTFRWEGFIGTTDKYAPKGITVYGRYK